MEILIWINTVVILAVVIVEGIVIRQISANLRESSEILSSNMKTAAETLSRLERISLATLERVAGGGAH